MKAYNPHSLSELASDLSMLSPQSKILAGGTDLIISLNEGKSADSLLYIGAVDELRMIRLDNDILEIGAGATMSEIAQSQFIPRSLAALKMAAGDMGSTQVRNKATVGGNIAEASPAGDLLPVLFLLEAKAMIMQPGGNVVVRDLTQLVTGAGQTSLAYNEIIIKFLIPLPGEGWQTAFQKLGYRSKVTIARITAAMGWCKDAGGMITQCILYLGAVSPTPIKCEAARLLIGTKADQAVIGKLADQLSLLVSATTSSRIHHDYKTLAIYGLVDDICAHIK